jgi:hypothetical protein
MIPFYKIADRIGLLTLQIGGAFIFAGLLSFAHGSESNRAGPSNRAFFQPVIHQAAQLFQAPDLNIGTDWLNTKKPLSLADLRGRVVLLDFWTLC